MLFFSLFLIFVFSNKNLINIATSLFGYLFSVTLNQLILNILFYGFHIIISKLVGYYNLIFQLVFLILLLSCMLGFRKLFLKYFRFFEQKEYQVFCILLIFEELLYTLIYIRLFIYGEQLGYPPEIVSINGLLFALLFVSAIILLLSIVSALRKEYLAKQKLSHMTALSA